AGKNLVGAFHQPSAVICDPLCFRTLPERELSSGYAEVLKYAVIGNPEILGMLDGPMEDLIAECVGIKAEIVSQDERDSGCRKLLNFGHTFGHAIEQASNYELLHGEAVAIGMVKACELAESKGLLATSVKSRLIEEFERRGLPTGTDLDPAEIKKYLKLDKKASGGKIDFVMPLDFGKCEVQSVDIEEL
ncbi:MAG: 3-dehydroquinate synthase, partial [Mogibacterium sp.]|nr:3-dehydroquinate synthase [Mogibacterium sp.]